MKIFKHLSDSIKLPTTVLVKKGPGGLGSCWEERGCSYGGDQHKTAFVMPSGQYKLVTCPFGLSNTPSYFQCLMNDILQDHIAAGYFL